MNSKNSDEFQYIHGASGESEEQRLKDQSMGAEQFLWRGLELSKYLKPVNSKPFLEPGCGVGAQTAQLLSRLPKPYHVLGVDIDRKQVERAQDYISALPSEVGRCTFQVEDICKMQYPAQAYSGAYISWVLEHIGYSKSKALLAKLKNGIEKAGILIANEIIMDPKIGMVASSANGTELMQVNDYIEQMIAYQSQIGGDANFGIKRNMVDCFTSAGFNHLAYRNIEMKYKKEDLQASINAAIQMFESAKENLMNNNEITEVSFQSVIEELKTASDITWNAGQVIVFVENEELYSLLPVECELIKL